MDFNVHKTSKYKAKTIFNRKQRQSIRLLKNALSTQSQKLHVNVLQDILLQTENGMPKIVLNRISFKGNYAYYIHLCTHVTYYWLNALIPLNDIKRKIIYDYDLLHTNRKM